MERGNAARQVSLCLKIVFPAAPQPVLDVLDAVEKNRADPGTFWLEPKRGKPPPQAPWLWEMGGCAPPSLAPNTKTERKGN
jgi:hypothetical protein